MAGQSQWVEIIVYILCITCTFMYCYVESESLGKQLCGAPIIKRTSKRRLIKLVLGVAKLQLKERIYSSICNARR